MSDSPSVWTRSAERRAKHARRWRIVWSVFAASMASTAAIAVAISGLAGLLFTLVIAVLVGATIALVAMGSNGDIGACVEIDGEHIIVDGVIPDRCPIAEITGFRVVQRTTTSTSPAAEGMRRKSQTRSLTLIEFERGGAIEPHLLLNGYLRVDDTELDELRSLLSTVLVSLPALSPEPTLASPEGDD